MGGTNGVKFQPEDVVQTAPGYICGSKIVAPISEVEGINTQALCEIDYHEQTIGVPRRTLTEGCVVRLVHISDTAQSTTYRIATETAGEWDQVNSRKSQRSFVMVLEPLIQTKPLTILYGTDVRKDTGMRPQKFVATFHKDEWTTPELPAITAQLLADPDSIDSYDVYRSEKDVFMIAVLFDSLVAPNIGLTEDFFSMIV